MKLPKSNKNTMLRYNDEPVIFCLHKLCCSHMKKNILWKFLGKNKDGTLYEFVQNIIRRNELSVLSTIAYEKLTNGFSWMKNWQLMPTVCPNTTEYFVCL